MNAFIYNQKCELIAKPLVTTFEEFKSDPTKFYPSWTPELIATDREYIDPIFEDGFIREKTREELILLDNKIGLLHDGEYIESNKIVRVEAPSHLFKKVWNKETNIWEEGATQDEIDIEVFKLIDEFTILGEKKERWIKYGFEVLEIEEKMAENIMKRNYLLTINTIN